MSGKVQQSVEIEKLLQWAYVDELPKRRMSSAEGIWDRLKQNGSLGGVDPDPGHGAAQRYAHFGLPHPDAEKIEKAVSALPDLVIDWSASLDAIFGDLAALVAINGGIDSARRRGQDPGRATQVSWPIRGTKRRRQAETRPRDVLLVGRLNTAALVTMHANAMTRPDWREDVPRPRPVPSKQDERRPALVGECKGKDRYSAGSYCPLKWEPSPITIAQSRADYACWHRGLATLAATLELESFIALPPAAPALPWRGEGEQKGKIYAVGEWRPTERLPLAPKRHAPLPPYRHKNGPMKKISA